MDRFDSITEKVGGGDLRMIGNNRRASSMPTQNNNNTTRSPRPTDIMSDDALRKLDDTLQKQFNRARDNKSKNAIQNQIYAVQEEIAKRHSSAEGEKPIEVISPKEKEKIKGLGVNVGAGALIFGVLGFLVGATTTKPKMAMLWGLGGGVLGGLGAFFISQEKSDIKAVV